MADKKPLSKELNVTILNTEKTLFEGVATSVTSQNVSGSFDVLPFHTNFISIIQKKIFLKLPSGEKKEFEVESGVMRVFENNVEIFLGIETVAQPENLPKN